MKTELVEMLIDLVMLLGLLLVLALWWATKYGGHRGRIAQRVRDVAQVRTSPGAAGESSEGRAKNVFSKLAVRLATLGERIPFFDAKLRLQLERDMKRAGFRSRNAASVMLGVKFVFGIVAAAGTVMLGSDVPAVGRYWAFRGIMMLGAFMVGMIAPEYVIRLASASRRKKIGGYLPDALDLLVICTNAGNSLFVSVRRVADELAIICPPLASEFALTADELRVSGDSERALLNLAERVDLPSIRALISTLTQSMRYGTPITQALRTLSRTERLAHMVSLEEKAAKLAPKMVLPMMIFILPAICAIAAGPAVIQLLDFIGRK
jgi:tight adherence protein C